MTESNTDLIRRLSRVLKEELQPRDIGFALVVTMPMGDGTTHLGITSNLEIVDACDALVKVVHSIANKPNIKLVDAGDREEGHA